MGYFLQVDVWNLLKSSFRAHQPLTEASLRTAQVVRAAFAPSGPKGCVKFFVVSRECSHQGFVWNLMISSWTPRWLTGSDSFIIRISLLDDKWWRDPVAKQWQLQFRNVLQLVWHASGAQVVTASQDHTARATWNALIDRACVKDVRGQKRMAILGKWDLQHFTVGMIDLWFAAWGSIHYILGWIFVTCESWV